MNHPREPIKATCPDINKYIKWIKLEIKSDRELKNMDQGELFNIASSMSSQLSHCIDYLEELRESNSTLREWGVEEADKVDELESKIYELELKLEV